MKYIIKSFENHIKLCLVLSNKTHFIKKGTAKDN